MARKSLLDSMDVPAPCPKKWDEMIGGDKARLCQSCDKHIHNISEMTRGEVRKLLFQSKESVCVYLEKDAAGKVQTLKKQFHKITRQAPIAAGVLSASLTFSALTYAQSDAVIGTTSATVSTKRQDKKTSQISFTFYDPNGEVVPNESVTLTNQKTKEEFTVLTNQQGVAQFSLIPHGRYDLLASSSIGFQDYWQTIQIKEAIEPNIKIYLSVAGTFIGVVEINSSEIPLFQAISQKDNDAVKHLINSGFDVNTKDSYNKTALHVAVEYDNLEIVRLLLDHNAKVNVKSKDKRTPLLMIDETVRDEDDKSVVEIARLLIAKGADINVQDDEGETALMMAGDGNLEVVKILLEAGANPNLRDKDGDTVLSLTSYDEIKQLLKRYGARQ